MTQRGRFRVVYRRVCLSWEQTQWQQCTIAEAAGTWIFHSNAGNRVGSYPYTQWNGEIPVEALRSVLCAYSTHNKTLDHEDRMSYIITPPIISGFYLSCLSVGWKPEDILTVAPKSLQHSYKTLPKTRDPVGQHIPKKPIISAHML